MKVYYEQDADFNIIKELKNDGVTIILTTHYIEEAEMIADRIGIINHGELLLIEEKRELIKRMSVKTLKVKLKKTLDIIPTKLKKYNLKLIDEGKSFLYYYNTGKEKTLKILDQILKGEKPEPGSYRGRVNNEPENNRKTLMDLKNA